MSSETRAVLRDMSQFFALETFCPSGSPTVPQTRRWLENTVHAPFSDSWDDCFHHGSCAELAWLFKDVANFSQECSRLISRDVDYSQKFRHKPTNQII